MQPGESLTITFQANVTVAITATATARITLSVGGVYDQVWRYADFDLPCGTLASSAVNASDPQAGGNVGGVIPGRCYSQQATFVNDLSYPITVHYAGYTDSGTIAPYIGGTLCDTAHCGTAWVDGITLLPGEASAPFTMQVGMPWFIGNESWLTSGSYQFNWDVTRLGDPFTVDDVDATIFASGPVRIDVLANASLPGSGVYTVTAVVPGNPAEGTWVINADNTITYTPAPGFIGNARAQYTVTDSGGQHATATITVTVQAPIQPSAPASIPMLGDLALALLALGMAGLYAQRVGRQQP